MGCICDANRKVTENLTPKYKGPFWNAVKLAVGVCKSELNLVLILRISEFDSRISISGNK